jgi:hypothetical protein
MKVQITLTVIFDPQTTDLTAAEHAASIESTLRNAIGNGLLTSHDPAAEVELYAIRAEEA